MRITAELVEDVADQRVDPNKDRSLVMRGHRIADIENLGITKNQYACIDLSDNEISRIDNIPTLNRLRTLIIASNVVSQIGSDAFEGLKELTSLVLSNNRISKLNTLIPIEQLVNLERLSLIGNPVTKVEHYRFFVIHLLQYSRKFRYLDFQRVTDAEREEAKRFFESSEGAELLAQTQPAIEESRVPKKPDVEPRFTFSAEILSKLRVAITDATDMETVSKLEHALKTGEISGDVAALIGLS